MAGNRTRLLLAVLVLLLLLAGLAALWSQGREWSGSLQTVTVEQRMTSNQLRLPIKKKKNHLLRHRQHHLTSKHVAGIEKFVFFTGYPRSGHSILGSLIDAHPNIVLSHSFYLFTQLLNDSSVVQNRDEMFNTMYLKSVGYSSVAAKNDKKGYTLDVPGSWSGKFVGSLKVIGDKSAKAAPDTFNTVNDPEKFRELYQKLQELVKVPVLVLHAVRNPYDIVATHALYAYSAINTKISNKKANFSEEHKMDVPGLLYRMAKEFVSRAKAVSKMITLCNMTVLEVHNEDLVLKPAATMREICSFLGLECPQKYIDACVQKVFPVVSKTRNKVQWPEKVKAMIDKQINRYPFFQRYTFD